MRTRLRRCSRYRSSLSHAARALWMCAVASFSFSFTGCESHTSVKAEVRGNDCVSCHADELDDTEQPPHAEALFGEQCGDCHDQRSWTPAPGYAHSRSFPLTLAHADNKCGACHERGYAPAQIQRECVDCHEQRANEVVDPVHAGLTTDCFACHRTDSFLPARFVHSWPLSGVHTTTECRACHVGDPATYEGTSTRCVSCHREDRLRADADSVEHAGYPDTCQSCHGADTFVVP